MAPEATENMSVSAGKISGGGRGYVTFLAGDGDYIKGVIGLAKGLRKVKSAYPLVVALLPDVPEEHRRILKSQGCIVREIQPIYPPDNQVQFAMAYYVINYSKLRIWNVSIYILSLPHIYVLFMYCNSLRTSILIRSHICSYRLE